MVAVMVGLSERLVLRGENTLSVSRRSLEN